MQKFLAFGIILFLFSCSSPKGNELKVGAWRGVLYLDSADLSLQLPFNFEVAKKDTVYQLTVINAEEHIVVEEVSLRHDSVFIRMPIFDSEFRLSNKGDSLVGVWINHSRISKNIIPFKAWPGQYNRFELITENNAGDAFNGKWEAEFSPKTENAYAAIGEFSKMDEIAVKGTFLTETGDYRYLQGISTKDELKLSCFDGSHAFLFKGKLESDGSIKGDFYSGRHWREPWTAKRNDAFELQNPDSLTFLKKGFDKFDFTFPDLEGKSVSLSDEKYRGSVVIVQIMGSWCPNCMDETAFLTWFYDKYRGSGLSVIGLAYEKTSDMEKAKRNVARLKDHFLANYDFLIAGTSDKTEASKTLPMLNKILSYPTTIFIDRKGVVRKIHTGFSGPATGKYYTAFEKETTAFVEGLLKE